MPEALMPSMPAAPPPTPAPPTPAMKVSRPKSTPVTKDLKRRVERCRTDRVDYIRDWSDSIEFHRGKPFADESDTDRIPVNKDWPRVKARVSSLFGQMPEVRLLPKHDAFAQAVPVFAKELNDTLKRADTDEAVFQALVDNTATAGVGVVLVDYQERTDSVETPLLDMATIPPNLAAEMMRTGAMPMEKQEVVTDKLFSVARLSPSDLVWDTEFVGFNFDKSDFVGRSGELGWAEAQVLFHLTEEEKEQVLGDGKEEEQSLKQGEPETADVKSQKVEFDEIFYWAYRFDAKEKYFKRIRRVVFVRGLPDPVIHEDWVGQQFDEASGTYVGSCRFPIRVLKINYVSDDAIPPSESAIGRPQVLELIESRTDQHEQRKRSKPLRWLNSNKLDPDTLVQMMEGTWQGWVPINGRGEDAMGEMARANYPPENSMFDRTVNHDLDEVFQTGANQAGTFASGERSASEARIVQQNFDMRNGLDRAHVAKFVQGIAEVMAGYLALFGDFEFVAPDDVTRLDQSWDRTRIAGEFVYEVIPDSMIRLDAHQQIGMLMDVLNMTAKSGFVNPGPLIADILSLAGRDPVKILTQPNPPPPPPLNISIRSAEDLRDPLMLALLMSTQQAPSPDQLRAAQQLLTAANLPPTLQPLESEMEEGTAPAQSATDPADMMVMEKISKRSDYE